MSQKSHFDNLSENDLGKNDYFTKNWGKINLGEIDFGKKLCTSIFPCMDFSYANKRNKINKNK